jgi:hypothetical protein
MRVVLEPVQHGCQCDTAGIINETYRRPPLAFAEAFALRSVNSLCRALEGEHDPQRAACT